MVSRPTQGDNSEHPRRPPAHRSVSLLHSPGTRPSLAKRRHSSSESSRLSVPNTPLLKDPPSSLRAQGRHSSGESSNAEKWFEQSNNDVAPAGVSYTDDEPPFFMRNSSSGETPPEVAQARMRHYLEEKEHSSKSVAYPTGLIASGVDGGDTEDFRSVIDDLTIKNKKLKRRLKKYEKLHDAHLKDEKLFEVRVHGLPTEKKRELEEILRKFASGLGQKGPARFPANGYGGLVGLKSKTASSQGNTNTDSAYASMSASARGGSSALSAVASKQATAKDATPTPDSRRQNIHSYLHQIPEGLLPRTNPEAMSERTKKKLVVKGLEQIFTGKGAGSTGHQQTEQQEEVSQLAARADRSEMEAQGQSTSKEGNREASIMRHDSEQDSATEQEAAVKVGEQDFAQKSPLQTAVDQRPTRPLDLDPHRAQVPTENIRYMRRLGFSPPYPAMSPIDDHGWIYLNLLVNMAQLHTVNVTIDFVRKALGEYSDRFEVSSDGRKVRWKGRPSRSGIGKHDSGATEHGAEDDREVQSPRKRPKLFHKESGRSILSPARGGATARSGAESNNRLSYTPMFFHKDSSDDGDDTSSQAEEYSETSPLRQAGCNESSAKASSGQPFTFAAKRSRKNDDGPIIFYNNARFCTDLSGERKPESNSHPIPYYKLDISPIGKAQHSSGREAEKRGPLVNAETLPEPMDLGDNPIPADMELTFPPQSPLSSGTSETDIKPIKLEVTGIGGVCPADNFAISVKSLHGRIDQAAAPEVSGQQSAPRSLPPRFANVFDGKGRSRAAVHKQVVFSRTQVLPPSELPPALTYMALDEESVEDDESEAGSDVSELAEVGGRSPPSQAPQPMDMLLSDSGDERDDDHEEESDDGESEAESDASLDLLAAAREFDPEAVRAKEREYDAHMADRLAEEIPAGSSAATAGGGSGFASPAFGVGTEEYQRAKERWQTAQLAGLKKGGEA